MIKFVWIKNKNHFDIIKKQMQAKIKDIKKCVMHKMEKNKPYIVTICISKLIIIIIILELIN